MDKDEITTSRYPGNTQAEETHKYRLNALA